jgi:hypothetical protein
MRPARLALLAALAIAPALAHARAWQGIVPGTSTHTDVTNRFGEPSTQGRLSGRLALVYREDRAPEGTRQAQFLLRDDAVVAEVNVFPAAKLDPEAVEGTYGKPAQKTFTDEFRAVWVFRDGVTVFFGKDGAVEAIRFAVPQAPARGAGSPAARAPSAEGPAAPAAGAARPAR